MKTKIFLEKSHPKPNYLLDTKLMFKNVLSRKFLYKSFGRKTLNINFKNSTKVTIIYFCQKTKKTFMVYEIKLSLMRAYLRTQDADRSHIRRSENLLEVSKYLMYIQFMSHFQRVII